MRKIKFIFIVLCLVCGISLYLFQDSGTTTDTSVIQVENIEALANEIQPLINIQNCAMLGSIDCWGVKNVKYIIPHEGREP